MRRALRGFGRQAPKIDDLIYCSRPDSANVPPLYY